MSARNSTTLASLEAKRDAKRRQVEALFEQQQGLKRQMDALRVELSALDDEIEAYQEEYSQEISYEKDEVVAVKTERPQTPSKQDDDNDDDVLTEHATASMTFPDEFLSDPTTQMTQQQQQYNAPPAQRPRSSGSGSGMIGQLELTRTNVSKKKHAAPPAGLKRTGESTSERTLDHYFGGGASRQQHQSYSSSSVARMPSPDGSGVARKSSPESSGETRMPSHNGVGVARMPSPDENNSDPNISAQIKDLLHNTFRIQNFRGHQEEIIHSTLVGQDVFVIMRTGGGKSLTYQLPALLEGRGSYPPKITLVVSPLLSLIQDQEDQLNQYCPGSAIALHSQLSREEQTHRWGLLRNAHSGVCLVLVTPEKVHKSNKLRNELQQLYEQGRLGRFVVDEAHCCSNWGHDFRPDYTKLGLLKTHFPSIPMLAVTATASDRVRNDVCNILRLGNDYQFFRSSARRPNLTYSVRPKTKDIVDDMANFIKENHRNDAGIIYTMTRKEADDLADKLCDRGIVARSYHSSVTSTNKERIHKSWMRNETQVVVGTYLFWVHV